MRLPVGTVLATLALGACVSIPRFERGEQVGAFERKRVQDKQGPSQVYAIDGSWCTVDGDRYAKVRVGDRIWCTWREKRWGTDTTRAGIRRP